MLRTRTTRSACSRGPQSKGCTCPTLLQPSKSEGKHVSEYDYILFITTAVIDIVARVCTVRTTRIIHTGLVYIIFQTCVCAPVYSLERVRARVCVHMWVTSFEVCMFAWLGVTRFFFFFFWGVGVPRYYVQLCRFLFQQICTWRRQRRQTEKDKHNAKQTNKQAQKTNIYWENKLFLEWWSECAFYCNLEACLYFLCYRYIYIYSSTAVALCDWHLPPGACISYSVSFWKLGRVTVIKCDWLRKRRRNKNAQNTWTARKKKSPRMYQYKLYTSSTLFLFWWWADVLVAANGTDTAPRREALAYMQQRDRESEREQKMYSWKNMTKPRPHPPARSVLIVDWYMAHVLALQPPLDNETDLKKKRRRYFRNKLYSSLNEIFFFCYNVFCNPIKKTLNCGYLSI